MSRLLRLPRAAFHPLPWLAAFLGWCATLWWLSSAPRPLRHAPPIPAFDKILHFGWFFGGAGLLCAFLLRLRPGSARSLPPALLAVALLAAIGALDEYHQSMVPGRSGNNPADWAADLVGATVGVLVFRRCGRPLLTGDPG